MSQQCYGPDLFTRWGSFNAHVYSTYLGGSGLGIGNGIAVDLSGNTYVTGYTQSTNFPTVNPLRAVIGGQTDAFVAKINASGSALIYSTYLGGSNDDSGNGIAVDSLGNAYVTGGTQSSNFPTVNAIQSNYGGGSDNAFVTKINASGSALVYSTYLGGSGDDWGFGIAVDSSGNAYITGKTSSNDFPTISPLQSVYGGGFPDAFVAKILPSVRLSVSRLTFANQPAGTASPPQTIALGNEGNSALTISGLGISGTNASDFKETDNCVGSVSVGASCSINVTFTADTTGSRTGILSIANNLTGSPLVVPLIDTGIAATRIVNLSANSLTFTSQMVGVTSAAQALTLTNTGNVALVISSLSISGTNGTDFAETDNCGGSISTGTSCSINVTFAPTATGTRMGTLTITDNATSPQSPQKVALTGTGVAPIVSVSRPALLSLINM